MSVRFRVPSARVAFDPIRRAPGTFILGLAAIFLFWWTLFIFLYESHPRLFVVLQIGVLTATMEGLWQLCEKRAGPRETPDPD